MKLQMQIRIIRTWSISKVEIFCKMKYFTKSTTNNNNGERENCDNDVIYTTKFIFILN